MEPRIQALRRQWIASALLLVVLAILVWSWPDRSFWYDETVNAYFAQRGWAEIYEWCTQIDNQAALGFILLKLWAGVVGASEFSLRAFSVCCALLTIAGLAALGRRVGGRDAIGWLAAALFALTQSFFYAAFEARPYALNLMLLAWSSVFLWDLWEHYGSPDRPLDGRYLRLLMGYLVLALAMAYTHYTGLLLAALAQGLYLLITTITHPSRRRLVIMIHLALGLLLGYAPWLVALAGRDIRGGTAMPGKVIPSYALRTYVDFWTHGQRNVTPQARREGLGMVLLLALSPIAWLVAGWKRARSTWRGMLFAALLTVIPMLVLLPLVYSFHGKLSGRHGWPCWLGASFVTALGLGIVERLRWARWPIWAIALALMWLPARTQLKPQFDSRLREAFAYINTHAKPEDALLLRDGSLFTAAEYYGVGIPWRGLPDEKLIDVRRALYVDEALDTLDELIAQHGTQRFWIVAWQAHIMDPQDLGAGLFEYLGNTRKVEGNFGDVAVSLFRLRESPQRLRERLAAATPRAIAPIGGARYLDGYIATREAIAPGRMLLIHTWWMRGELPQPDLRLSIRLVDDKGSFFKPDGSFYCAVDQPPGAWSFTEETWAPDKPVLSRIWLWVPKEMPVGPASIVMVVYDTGNRFEPLNVPIIQFEVEAASDG